ncbi:glycosyltransferase family 2 protein [uncultured Helicobacter sp.]|uniref:glycosyltransferase family 2 protein n=1 Tax=uncultured Helicobacter sp. TaxID=175537 RepID=UPI001F8D13F9|nr:glycosyltransferase family 2 protein [uncultured Helicobacter sp.]HIY44367.1 glycosyltransferase family 2 protein [Candidatus Helicobacter avistercoris]
MNPLISVIIPIYNVAPYLRACLDSILSQTYQNLQIILVNDGSTDESEDIAKEYLRDERVELICVQNGGLSKARNIGLHQARGEYIYFIDSDDYTAKGFLQEMVEIAQRFEVEFVCNDHIATFGINEPKYKERIQPKEIEVDSQSIMLGGAVWRCLIAKSLLVRSGVSFLEGKIYEDEGFLYMILPFVNKFVRYCGEPYFYRQRENSIMSNHKRFRSYDLLDVFEAIYRFYQSKGFLQRLNPPYYFLHSCAYGYENEKEYLKKAKKLAKDLQLPPPPPKNRERIVLDALVLMPSGGFFYFIRFYHRFFKISAKIKKICKIFYHNKPKR